ncbi:hypothetical protein [Flavobacterium sp. F52]|uniref:hypothetical protein n=1 Tax=Flavobacterium sp. F52 TaxID=1202532 RepID=UPI0012F80302|nr:hypothetical protein [Flavobacterium sp. F52]
MITAKGSLTDHRYKWYKWKRYTPRGKQAIGFGFLVALALFLQDINNRNISKENDKKLDQKEASRTKEIKAGVKDATDQIFDGLSLAFKKQGLQYDTIKNQVLKLRDSVRVTNNYGETPLLTLKALKIIDSTTFGGKTYKIEYEIFSEDAKSLNIDVKFDVFAFTPNLEIRTLIRNFRPLYKGENIGKEKGLKNWLIVPKDDPYYDHYAFRLKGSYSSSTNVIHYIDKFFLIKPRLQKDYFGNPSQAYEDLLRANLIKFQIN